MTRIIPLVLDSTLSGYALARAFHEAYGQRAIALAPFTTGAINGSSLFSQYLRCDKDMPPSFENITSQIRAIAARFPDDLILPLTNNDPYVLALSTARDTLGDNVVVPHETPEMLSLVSDKLAFAQACGDLSIATPATYALDFANQDTLTVAAIPFEYPIIVKPADSSDYVRLQIPGKQKVYTLNSPSELGHLIDLIAATDFDGVLLAQDFIPGNDIYSITIYRARTGEITALRTAQVYLQDPRPSMLGVPDVMVVTDIPELARAATRFVCGIDYHGFGNFDVMRDARTGQFVFLEINPRYGRNCFYATGTGANVAVQLVEDILGRPTPAPVLETDWLYSNLPPTSLRLLLPAPLRARARQLVRSGCWGAPLKYKGEQSLQQRAYAYASGWNLARHYLQYRK